MGFVGNYAPHGLSPQMYDMPVIPKKSVTQSKVSDFFISKAVFGSVDKPWGRGIKMNAPFHVSVYGKGAFN